MEQNIMNVNSIVKVKRVSTASNLEWTSDVIYRYEQYTIYDVG